MILLRQDNPWCILGSRQDHSNPWCLFFPEYRVEFLAYVYGFHMFLPTFYGKLGTITDTVWMRVFQRDNVGSERSSYVNIFRDRRTQW